MKKVDNTNETTSTEALKNIKKASKDLVELAENNEIPMLIVYYEPKKGYQYNYVLPEQFNSEDCRKQYGKFGKFLQVVIDLNEGLPVIQNDGETAEF